MALAFVYPGQGAQNIGMGSDFYNSPLCKEANDVCGFDLVQVMQEGPADLLQSTTYCQPALFLHSALVLESLQSNGFDYSTAQFHLGLSLGEYTALYGAGVMSFSDVMKVLVVRGKAMQDACDQTEGGMVSVLELDLNTIQSICEKAREGGVLQAANLNAPGQIVVSGDKQAIERSIDLFKEAGARRALPLKVAGAFHSPLMSSAEEPLRNCLESCSFQLGANKVISNVTAKPHQDGKSQIIDTLVKQITSSVLWSQSIENLSNSEGVKTYFELGTGKVLSGLIRRTVKDTELKNADSLEGVKQLCGVAE